MAKAAGGVTPAATHLLGDAPPTYQQRVSQQLSTHRKVRAGDGIGRSGAHSTRSHV